VSRASSITVASVAFFVAALASISGIKVFDSWGQVNELWESEINPLLLIGHPHMPRYLVAYPGFLLDERLPGIGFSFYIAVFVAINFVLFRAVALLAIQRKPSLPIYLVFAAIHLAMNGRGAIAWAGWLLCIWVCHKISMNIDRPASQLGWVALSCWLASVSTGVFIVVVMTFLFFILRHHRPTQQVSLTRRVIILCLAVPLGYAVLEYFLIAVEKNIDFYGGGMSGAFNMLAHGLGVVFLEINLGSIVLLWFIAYGAVVVAFAAISSRRRFSPLACLILLPVFGGLFGFTVLTLVIPPLLLRLQGRRRLSSDGRNRSSENGALTKLKLWGPITRNESAA
jgi:membrane protein implicated in regulation of membrane protease activity